MGERQKHINERQAGVIESEVLVELQELNPEQAFGHLLTRILDDDQQYESKPQSLRRFYYILNFLKLQSETKRLSAAQINQFLLLGETILRSLGICEGRKLYYLHRELSHWAGKVESTSGNQLRALWTGLSAFGNISDTPTESENGEQALSLAENALRLGHTDLALKWFSTAEKFANTKTQALMGQLRTLRLSGQFTRAWRLATELSGNNPSEKSSSLNWEVICLKAQSRKDIMPMIISTSPKSPLRSGVHLLECFLWARVNPSVSYWPRLPKVRSIRTYFREEIRTNAANKFFYHCVRQIETCYETQIPLRQRINELGRILENIGKLASVEQELLVWGASVRWLVRVRQSALAGFAYKQYSALSLRLSHGENPDILGSLENPLSLSNRY